MLAALVVGAMPAAGQDVPASAPRIAASGARLPPRSVEEVAQVMNGLKGPVYAKYNEALKRDPHLAGKVVVELTIVPSGEVSQVSIKSSDMGDADFLAGVRAVFLQAKFGDEAVDRMIVTYPLVFVPR